MEKARILVVEDQSIIALDLQNRLIGLGYDVPLTLAYAEEAVRRCGDLHPDLVLMDIRLKGEMDGIQAAQMIRAEHDVPVVFLTAYSDEPTLQRAQQIEPHGYLLKPFEDRELRLTIEIALYKYRMELALKQNERWLGAILRGISDAVVATDVHGRVQFMNPVAEAMTGWPQAEAQNRPVVEVFNIVETHTRARSDNLVSQVLEQHRSIALTGQALLVARDGRETPVDETAAPLHDDKGRLTGAVLIIRDVTERKRAEEKLRQLAYHDSLTGLPNRALLQILVGQALAHTQRHGAQGAVLFVDLDRFKTINDTLGHATGDQLLKAVAARLTRVLRQSDTVARIGGDEFTILIEEIEQPQDAAHVAEKILSALAEPFDLAGQELFISASIGISIFPTDGHDLQSVLKNADTALYRVKDQGRNGYAFYQAEMNAAALNQLAIENSLRRALQREEFILYYQPKVASTNGRVIGVEALLRWHHPELGLVPPGQFLSLAEETGLIVPIGEWTLRTACQQAKTWLTQHHLPPLRVAVNLSNRQFRQPDLVAMVARVLAETALPASALELELTETVIMQDRETAIAKLQALKQMGVFISIDDFGTGYSSLEYIRHLHVDGIKIDRSFVRAAHIDEKDEAIVKAIVTLAHSLSIRVTAEGVETVEQHGFMRACECDETQGFYFGHPMAPDAFLRLMKKGTGLLNPGPGPRPA